MVAPASHMAPALVGAMEQNRAPSVKPSPVEAASGPSAQGFDTTHWSLVVQAQDCTAPRAQAALATLCQSYWYPMYAYIRRQSASADEAEELTQEFFTLFLEKGVVSGAEQAKGK